MGYGAKVWLVSGWRDGAGAGSWLSSSLVPVSSDHLSLFVPAAKGYQRKLAF